MGQPAARVGDNQSRNPAWAVAGMPDGFDCRTAGVAGRSRHSCLSIGSTG